MMRAVSTQARRWLLGDDPRQQLRASQALLSLGIYGVLATIQHAEVLLGLLDETASWRLTAFYLSGATAFYLAIRLGLNQRMASDKALTVPQILWGLVTAAWSYSITGPARGAILVIVMLLVTFSIFSLKPRQVRLLSLTGFLLLGAAMIWRSITQQYDPRVEGIHLGFTAVCIWAVSQLSIRVGAMRAHLQQQKSELAAALARIQALATQDELTGLTNRRSAMEQMRSELAVRSRPARCMSLALLDIDHFKRVNDTLGHAAGDAVLKRFADVARALLRTGDILARWGGEEFLLVLPASSMDEATAVLARLRDSLLATPLDDITSGLVITFSAGVARCDDMQDLEAAIERADAAMYQAKRAGRDRTLAAA